MIEMATELSEDEDQMENKNNTSSLQAQPKNNELNIMASAENIFVDPYLCQ